MMDKELEFPSGREGGRGKGEPGVPPSMTEYTFPFSTLEKPNANGIAQPYSAGVNALTCAIIFYYLLKTKTNGTFILLLSIFCFELFHVFSHVKHIPGAIQINITHALTYCMNLSFCNLFYRVTNFVPSWWFITYMILLVIFDIFAFTYYSFVFYLATQSLVFISLLLCYFPMLPKTIQKGIYQIIVLVSLVIVLFLNEKYNGEKMMSFNPDFPYHVFIEIVGLVLFYVICSSFYAI
jgi:hypothetical protein